MESVQAFEKAFGLDRLEKIIAETRHKRGVSIFNMEIKGCLASKGILSPSISYNFIQRFQHHTTYAVPT